MDKITIGLIKAASLTPTTVGTTLGILSGMGHGLRAAMKTKQYNPDADLKKLLLGGVLTGALVGGGTGYVGGSVVDNIVDRLSKTGPGYKKRKEKEKEEEENK